MKRILIILALFLTIGILKVYADDIGIPFQVWASTATGATPDYVYNGSCRIDEIYVINYSTNMQTVTFYDNAVEKWRITLSSPTATIASGNGFTDKDIHFNTPIKFYTNCTVKSADTYGNQKVLVQGVKQ